MRSPAKPSHAIGKFEWARLKTSSRHWDRHAERDRFVIGLMQRETSLQIGNDSNFARASNLEELSTYPFLFAESISSLSAAEDKGIAEYVRRGGFLLVDACIDTKVNPDWQVYLTSQLSTLDRLFPGVRVEKLGRDHEVFSNYFGLSEFPPQTHSRTKPAWANHSTEPLRGVFLGDRMIGIVSLSGFQCGLVGAGETATNAVKMISNIYVYAMTH